MLIGDVGLCLSYCWTSKPFFIPLYSMKKYILVFIIALFGAAGSVAQTTGEDFDPARHSTFTTDRADGRFLSSRGISHRMMTGRPPRHGQL